MLYGRAQKIVGFCSLEAKIGLLMLLVKLRTRACFRSRVVVAIALAATAALVQHLQLLHELVVFRFVRLTFANLAQQTCLFLALASRNGGRTCVLV